MNTTLHNFTIVAPRNAGAVPTTFLDRERLERSAPSIFAQAAHSRTSARYSFLPTASVLDGLASEGWLPVKAVEQRVRDDSREGFQKHSIRFAHRDFSDPLGRVGDFRPEIVLVNSHDRSSAYNIHVGIFRLVCSNGLVVADATFGRISIPHINFDPARVIEASVEITREIPRLTENVNAFKSVNLDDGERLAFAEAATILRFDSIEKAPVAPAKLLEPRRSQDSGRDLWTTLNTVQENVIRGGQRDRSKDHFDRETGRFVRARRTRAVNGIDGNIGLNKALWHLAESLKAAKLGNN